MNIQKQFIKKPEIGSLVYVPDYDIFSLVHDVDIYDFKDAVLISAVAASRYVPFLDMYL